MTRSRRARPRWLARAAALAIGLATTATLGMTLWAFSPAAKTPREQALRGVRASLLQVRANLGSARAQFLLAEAFAGGDGVPHDDAKALAWYRRAAGNGHVIAQYILGRYLHGRAEGLSWWTKAAEAGHMNASAQLAHIYSHVGPIKPAEAVALWRILAETRGDTDAKQRLAWALHAGWGVERNQQEALAIWRQLASQGNAMANYHLGAAAARGDGVPRDPAEAVRLWLLDRDRPYLQKRYLALCRAYEHGEGVARDPAEAAHWCRPVAMHKFYEGPAIPEDAIARRNFATASTRVIAIVDDQRERAEALAVVRRLLAELRTGALSGDSRAQYLLAEALSTRQWVECNPREAREWFTRAAAQGHADAAARLEGLQNGTVTACFEAR